MRLQFKHQKFQADAAKAVVDVFAGQPYLTPTYRMDRGINYQQNLTDDEDFTGWRNEPIVPELADKIILERLNKIQRINQIEPSAKLERSESCKYNLTIEMDILLYYFLWWSRLKHCLYGESSRTQLVDYLGKSTMILFHAVNYPYCTAFSATRIVC